MNDNDDIYGSQERDARLARAAMKSLSVAAPESLKAELKRRARARLPAPSIWDGLRRAWRDQAWAYGAGAAFAAACAVFAVWHALPPSGRSSVDAPVAVAHPQTAPELAVPPALAELWSDDDGGDDDDI